MNFALLLASCVESRSARISWGARYMAVVRVCVLACALGHMEVLFALKKTSLDQTEDSLFLSFLALSYCVFAILNS